MVVKYLLMLIVTVTCSFSTVLSKFEDETEASRLAHNSTIVHASNTFQTYKESDKLISLVSETQGFNVALDSNPTTGFTWKIIDVNRSVFKVPLSKYKSSAPVDSKILGHGGVVMWHFQFDESVKRPVNTEVTLSYAQHWKGGSKGRQAIFSIHAQ